MTIETHVGLALLVGVIVGALLVAWVRRDRNRP